MPSTQTTESTRTLLVLHASATGGRLHIWGESSVSTTAESGDRAHPNAVPASQLAGIVQRMLGEASVAIPATLQLRLPEHTGVPLQSPQLAHWTGRAAHQSNLVESASFGDWTVDSVSIQADHTPRLLERMAELAHSEHERTFDEEAHPALADHSEKPVVLIGDSVRWYLGAARLGVALLVEQRFVPMLLQDEAGQLHAAWRPWFSDEATATRVGQLLR